MAFYVDITGLPDNFLAFVGYILVDEDADFQVYINKSDQVILPKIGTRYLYVEDINDATILKSLKKIPVPPWP